MADKKKCFVVGPIGSAGSASRIHADWLFDGIISPTFAANFGDFEVKRSDKISSPGMIDSQMINRLLDDDLVIADLSELNPNAFYEIGIRHMIRKPIIHMFLEGTNIPFDVSPYRAIPFQITRHSDVESAKRLLQEAVEEVLRPGYEVENPVTRARGAVQVDQHATPAEKLMLGRLDTLEEAVGRLSKSKGTILSAFRRGVPASAVFRLPGLKGLGGGDDLERRMTEVLSKHLVRTLRLEKDSLVNVAFSKQFSDDEAAELANALLQLGAKEIRVSHGNNWDED